MPGRCWPVGLVLVKRPLLVAFVLFGAAVLWLSAAESALALNLTVDTTSDSPALQACTAAAGDCSLRGAILRANAVAGPHTITLPAGEYDLTGVSPGGYNTDGAAAGNLVIAQNITINGVTPDLTTITYSNATALDHRDRIFHVLPAGNLTVSNLSVRGGGHGTASGTDKGGGVWAQGPLTMDRVSVRLNSQAFGGGVYVENTTDIHASTININSAVSGGGVFIGGFGVYTAKILNTTISSNSASNLGGGIEFDGLSPNIVATLNNVTVAFNQAGNGGTGGGGLYIGTLGSLVMRNTLVAFNSGSNPSCAGTVSSQGHNLVDQSTAGPGTCGLVDGVNGDIISTADSRGLRLTGLQGNGGPTATHALGHASDALDKGDPAPPGSGGTACEATDQRGLPRTIDGDGDGISRCDIGAVEGGVWYAVDTTTDGNDPATLQVCDADLNNGNCSLRGAISRANAAETATPGTAAVITLPATGAGNPYLLAVPGTGEDQNATGDLDIRADITIVGGGANTTIVDGNQIDRLFDVKSSPANARLRLQDLTVQNGNGFVGGAIAADLPFFLLRVRMRGNTAQDGGGIWLGSTSGSITNSSIIANIATRPGGGGGGIDQFGNGTLTITNTTISGNQAQNGGNGGGIVQIQGTIHLANVTLAGNSAAEMGGLDLLGSVNVVNTLIAGNTVSSGGMHPNCGGSSIPASQGYNLVFGGDTCGFTQGTDQHGDPRLGPLQFNGGPTETMALLSGSAAIDAGNTAIPLGQGLACAATDQRGMARPVDGDGVSGPRCDIGAYEAQLCTTRPHVSLGVLPGSPGRLSVNVTAGSGNIAELRLHALPTTNILVNVGSGDQSGELTIPVNAATRQFTIRRANGVGAGTLPFDVVDGCGVWPTFAGGGPNAWGTGGGPGSPSATPAPAPPGLTPTPGAACASFASQADAQAYLRRDPSDPLTIDRNRNGIACEGADGAGFMNHPWDETPVPRP